MDLVFIVDDSGSMQEEQSNLAANFPKFVKVLNDYQTKSGSKLDWRVAVTTTGRDVDYNISPPIPFPIPLPPQSEKGDNGAFRQKKDCGSVRRWVERNDSNADQTFSCLAEVGTSGPSIEMPLESLKLALNDRVADGTNAGFLRPDALLAVVILTDEDDCSRQDNNFTIADDVCITMQGVKPVAEYKAMLDGVAGGANRWATAVIAGDKACTSGFGKAIDAQRLKQFVNLVGKNGMFSSICNGDLTTSLQDALSTFDAACKSFPGVK
ncbi:putative lipoprotein [Labilithrix luteola]|uniref:Putative lipoprotein n=2 Tax=Labilithrix luteola TaxID=1391654 RepID=A0A0K1Q106_9BACT|nr:putative lipoprotein [Labilithrix luteola]